MNIVKFKDVRIDGDKLFNENFKGKYCYAVKMTKAVTFDSLTESQYSLAEQTGLLPEGAIEISLSDYNDYIDFETTSKINSITKYESYNQFIPDTEITIDELKKFREWLATTLLDLDQDAREYEEKTKEMLWYYKKNMYNNVVKQLSNFIPKNQTVSIQFTPTSSCACTQHVDMTGLTTACDPVSTYKKGVYEHMVTTFSQVDFWKDLDADFLTNFKAYIDGIIGYNLPLSTVDYVSEFADCGCVNVADTAQKLLINILKNLSTSLGYIIDGDITGHKNFIASSFREWAEKLYEKMYWA